jgi:5-methylthioribose kinase
MIRRCVGVSHVADLESIADADVRARCERRALAIGTTLVKMPHAFASMEAVAAFARDDDRLAPIVQALTAGQPL